MLTQELRSPKTQVYNNEVYQIPPSSRELRAATVIEQLNLEKEGLIRAVQTLQQGFLIEEIVPIEYENLY